MTKNAEQDAPQPAPEELPMRRSRRSGYVLWRILVLSFSAVMAVLIAVPVLMIGQEVRAPSWVAQRMEEQASAALDGGTLEFGTITVTFGTDFHPRLRMTQTVLRNAQGRLLARVPGIDVLVSPRGLLLRGELLVQEVVLSGAQLTLDRGQDGSFALALGNDGAVFGTLNPNGPSEPAPETRAAVSPAAAGLGSLVSFMEGITQRPTLEALEHVTAEGLIINYNDARAGRSWTVDGGRIDLDLGPENLHFDASFTLLSGRAYVTELTLAYDSAPNTHVAQLSLALRDAAARDIATQSPALEWLKPVDAPVSLRLNATLDAAGRLDDLTGGFELGRGRLQKADGQDLAFDSVKAEVQFDPAAGENGVLRFEQVELRSDWANVTLEGEAYLRSAASGAPSQISGQIRLVQAEINPPGGYAQPLALAEGYVAYRLQLAPMQLDIASLVLVDSAPNAADAPPARLIASGQLIRQDDGWHMSTQARVAEIGVERILALWPPALKTRLRVWVETSLPQGLMRNVQAALRLTPGQPPQVQITHEFVDTTLRFMPTLPPIRGARGFVVFDGHSYVVQADAGSIT
ncbi:MAG: hypothetical protein JKX69_08500, partial [Rhodobacteraceae bacterium]|nr:hypothetical protein [Paracoccaceae bacterium]